MPDPIKNNPIITAMLVQQVATIGAALGLKLSPELILAVGGLVGTVVMIWARSRATGPVTAAKLAAELVAAKAAAK